MNADAFVGKPFRAGAHGPDAFDCWGLVHTAARELYGLALPDAVYANVTPQAVAQAACELLYYPEWQECPRPAAGRVLALGGYDGRVRHVALCLDEHRALHAARALRSCIMPVHKLTALYPLARYYAWAR